MLISPQRHGERLRTSLEPTLRKVPHTINGTSPTVYNVGGRPRYRRVFLMSWRAGGILMACWRRGPTAAPGPAKMSGTLVSTCVEIKISRPLMLNRRVALHAIDATPARWRGDAVPSPLDGASAATSSPRNDLVKNRRCTRRTGWFPHRFRRASRIPRRYQMPRAWHTQNHNPSAIVPRRARPPAPS